MSKRFENIIESNKEPSINSLWIKDGVLYYFSGGTWRPLSTFSEGGGNSNTIELENKINTLNTEILNTKSSISKLTTNQLSIESKLNNITLIPEGGSVGQVLKKSATGVEWGVDNNSDTTYTFTNGTDGSFIVTPSNSTAKKITIGTIPTKTSLLTNDSNFLTQHQNISNLVSKTELLSAIDNIPATDLSGYYNKAEVDAKVTALQSATNTNVSNLTSDLTSLENKVNTSIESNAANFATKTEVDSRIKEVIGTAPEALDTLGEIAEALSDNDDAIGAINGVLAGKASSADVYTKTDVYTKSEVDAAIADVDVSAQLKNYLTKTEAASIYLTEHLDISGKANVGDSYTKIESDNKYLTEHQSLADYAKKSELPIAYDDTAIKSRITTLETIDHSLYLTEHQDISNLATKTELSTKANITDVYTKQEVDKAIAGIDGSGTSGNYLTEEEADEKYQTKGNYLTEHQDISSKANTADVYTKSEVDAKLTTMDEEMGDAFMKYLQGLNTDKASKEEVSALETELKASIDTKADTTAIPTKVSELINDSGYTSNVGTITEIKMNDASMGTSGVVNLGYVLTYVPLARVDEIGGVWQIWNSGMTLLDNTAELSDCIDKINDIILTLTASGLLKVPSYE